MPGVPPEGESDLLKVSEIAQRLNASPQGVRQWIERGELPAFRLGKEYRVPRAALEAWLERGRLGPAAPTSQEWERVGGSAPTAIEGAGSEEERRRKERAAERLAEAAQTWAQAIVAHQMAPPDPGFAGRIRALGQAAREEEAACRELHEAGLSWAPIPDGERAEVPYELRPGTGRRGPQDLWLQFDGCVYQLNHAITRNSAAEVGAAFGALAEATEPLARAIDEEGRGSTVRRQAG